MKVEVRSIMTNKIVTEVDVKSVRFDGGWIGVFDNILTIHTDKFDITTDYADRSGAVLKIYKKEDKR